MILRKKDNQLTIEIELEDELPPEPVRIIAEQGSQPPFSGTDPRKRAELVQQAVVPEEIEGIQRTGEHCGRKREM